MWINEIPISSLNSQAGILPFTDTDSQNICYLIFSITSQAKPGGIGYSHFIDEEVKSWESEFISWDHTAGNDVTRSDNKEWNFIQGGRQCD